MPTTMTWVYGTPKLRFYDMDFGWGKPKKLETVSIDYTRAISINSCKESNGDLEIGVCISATEMENFVQIFDNGLKAAPTFAGALLKTTSTMVKIISDVYTFIITVVAADITSLLTFQTAHCTTHGFFSGLEQKYGSF
ncbi:malonyl-coenzyme A:anthocyanin 3-O-glucoside-6''-O-malonyltransferase-like protein [Tanacetum coccineum]